MSLKSNNSGFNHSFPVGAAERLEQNLQVIEDKLEAVWGRGCGGGARPRKRCGGRAVVEGLVLGWMRCGGRVLVEGLVLRGGWGT